MNKELLEVCNMTYNGDPPSVWRQGGILPFPKKGDLGLPSNYRGITLTPSASKIYNRMLLNRIRPHLDPKLRINQNGFRPGRSTVAQILTLRRLIEGVKAKNLPAVMTFVDFRKAFDSIHRGKLMKILKAYGVPAEVVSAIEVLYVNTTAKVISPDGDTEFFGISAGVLQGDTLAPYLFIVALDYALRIAMTDSVGCGFTLVKSKSRRHPAINVTDTDYADDIALLSDSIEEADLLLHRVEQAAKLIGLHINEDKTEFMIFNQEHAVLKTADRKPLKQAEDFDYLGSSINSCKKTLM